MRPLAERLDDAMLHILQEHTFYWTILQKLSRKIIPNDEQLPGCKYAATDGFEKLVFNEEHCNDLTTEALVGLNLHEVQHVAHFHPMRKEDREITLWNIACDYAVNDLIFEQGLRLPEGALYDIAYEGMAPEEIYELLYRQRTEKEAQASVEGGAGTGQSGTQQADSSPQPPQDKGDDQDDQPDTSDDGETGGDGNQPPPPGESGGKGGNDDQSPPPGSDQGGPSDDEEPAPLSEEGGGSGEGRSEGLTPTEMKVDWTHGDLSTELATAWENLAPEIKEDHRQRIESLRQRAIMIAQSAGKDLTIADVSDRAAVPPPDWKSTLRSFVLNNNLRDDYTWARPNRRFVPQGVYLPSLTGTYDPESIVLAIDNSGSMSRYQLDLVLEEVGKLMVDMPTTIFHIMTCDTRVNAYHRVTSQDLPLDFTVNARGGTRFTPIFQEVTERDIFPESLIYFTDMGSSDYPSDAPPYPVLWLNYGHILPSTPQAIKKELRKVRHDCKIWMHPTQFKNLDNPDYWMTQSRLPAFGDLTNMLTAGERRR